MQQQRRWQLEHSQHRQSWRALSTAQMSRVGSRCGAQHIMDTASVGGQRIVCVCVLVQVAFSAPTSAAQRLCHLPARTLVC